MSNNGLWTHCRRCDLLVHPQAICLMKYHTLIFTYWSWITNDQPWCQLACRWSHSCNSCAHWEMLLSLQQSWLVYSSCEGSCLALWYLVKSQHTPWNVQNVYSINIQNNLSINPMAIGQKPSNPSDSVSIETSTFPLLFPTFLYQEAKQLSLKLLTHLLVWVQLHSVS